MRNGCGFRRWVARLQLCKSATLQPPCSEQPFHLHLSNSSVECVGAFAGQFDPLRITQELVLSVWVLFEQFDDNLSLLCHLRIAERFLVGDNPLPQAASHQFLPQRSCLAVAPLPIILKAFGHVAKVEAMVAVLGLSYDELDDLAAGRWGHSHEPLAGEMPHEGGNLLVGGFKLQGDDPALQCVQHRVVLEGHVADGDDAAAELNGLLPLVPNVGDGTRLAGFTIKSGQKYLLGLHLLEEFG